MVARRESAVGASRGQELRSTRARSTLLAGLILLATLGAGLVLVAGEAAAQVAVPFSQTNVSLPSTATTVTYTVDLSTLPERPRMTAEVVPDAAHPGMQLQVEISGCNLVNPFGSCPTSLVSAPGTGPRSVSYEPWRCIVGQTWPAYVGKTCNVKVRALDFGTVPPPARFDLSIRAVTVVPTSTTTSSITTSVSTSSSGSISTSTASFVNEGQNFRWIYDLDHDDVLITPVAGRCEVANNGSNLLPYTYQFQGSPSYAGLDCCTWQIDSSTGIVGTGQALFFINVDAGNPANQPPDADVDGIKNLCDNCPGVPNGPLLGSCTSGSKIGKLCRSNLDCPGGACSLAQDDLNLDGTGNACVPEPGLGASLASGLIALAARAPRSGARGLAVDRPDSRRSKGRRKGRGDA